MLKTFQKWTDRTAIECSEKIMNPNQLQGRMCGCLPAVGESGMRAASCRDEGKNRFRGRDGRLRSKWWAGGQEDRKTAVE